MGLDISTKGDYARFSWHGAVCFCGWSRTNLGLDPFPGWDGGNGMGVVFDKEPDNEYEVKGSRKDAEKWLRGLEKYAKKIGDNILECGTGDALGQVMWRSHQLGVSDTKEKHKLPSDVEDSLGMKDEFVEWEYLQAIKWYFVLKDGLKNGHIFYG